MLCGCLGVVSAVALLMFSDSVSDAHVGCCSPSRLRMRGAVYALPVLVLVLCRMQSGRESVSRLFAFGCAFGRSSTPHHIHSSHTTPRNIHTPHTLHTTHTTITPHTTRHSLLHKRKSEMVCPLWYVWDALRCFIKSNTSIQSCNILSKLN